MNAFSKILAGIAALLITSMTMGLSDAVARVTMPHAVSASLGVEPGQCVPVAADGSDSSTRNPPPSRFSS
jgi:hypothetical protein